METDNIQTQVEQPIVQETQVEQPTVEENVQVEGQEIQSTENQEGQEQTQIEQQLDPEIQAKLDKLAEYEASKTELDELNSRLGVNDLDFTLANTQLTKQNLDNITLSEYNKLCTLYGVDSRPGEFERSLEKLAETDAKKYVDFTNKYNSLNATYEAKSNEIRSFERDYELRSYINTNKQLLDYSPAISESINTILQVEPNIPVQGLQMVTDLLTKAYAEGLVMGQKHVKANEVSDPAKILNSSNAVTGGGNIPISHNKVFTRDEINKMSVAEYEKNQSLILSQYQQGLIN